MAKVKECDRCGEIYGIFGGGLFGDMGLLDRDGKKLDLCVKCLGELEYWYGNETKDFLKRFKPKKK